MKINALYILSLAFLSTGAWAQSPEKPFFDGAVDSASRVTMSRTDTAIEKYRKGDFTLVLTDKKGRPVNGSVEVELARHAFNFGVSMYGVSALPEGPLKEKALAGRAGCLQHGHCVRVLAGALEQAQYRPA